ncbi:MAG: hypothetical protein R1F54_01020 [Candidatus Zeuxoniibacter abyssi]|nr:MAG: hypothetical protein R1F54_01020 [Candidatus Persebacteraceae bacterium AB1(2)]
MQTYTRSNTSTYARHIASKVAADLKRLQRIYGIGSPSNLDIDNNQEEIALLLDHGYLGEVTYGFKRNEQWLVALKYKAVGSQLVGGDDPGGIGREGDILGAYFTSFLTYSQIWFNLSQEARRTFKLQLPFQRVEGSEPSIANGYWVDDRSYSSGELGVKRSMIKRY